MVVDEGHPLAVGAAAFVGDAVADGPPDARLWPPLGEVDVAKPVNGPRPV